MPGSPDDPVRLDLFQTIREVHWESESSESSESSSEGNRCGVILQVGRWRTGVGSTWQVSANAGQTITAGTFNGTTNPHQWDVAPFTKLAFNMYPPYDINLTGEFDILGNSGNRAAVFNFQKMLLANGDVDDIVTATLQLFVSPGSNSAQWQFSLDTFEIDEAGTDPTFSQGTQPDDNGARFGVEFIGQAPLWIPTAAILDSGRVFVPHTSGTDILTFAEITANINTKTGELVSVGGP